MANQLTNTNQIAFLHGSESSLQALRTSEAAKIQPGAFYITSDTNRMYLGVQDGQTKKIVSLNQDVITVEKIANLPTSNIEVGYFYYAAEENILCVYNGSQWVQINPDTSISQRGLTASKKAGEKYLKVDDTITTSDNASHTAFWGFDETNGNVTISVAAKTEGTGNTAITRQMFTIKCNVTIGTEASTNTGIIKLSESGNDTKKVIIKPGTNSNLTVKSDANGNITIDDAGLRNNDIQKITHTIDTNGIIKTELTRENNNTDIYDTFKPQISYGKASTTATKATKTANFGTVTSSANGEFDIGTAKLDVYTTEEVDALIEDAKSTLNAMVFKGTLNGSVSLPSINNNVCIGDTYKVAVNKKYHTDGTLDTDSTLDSGKQWATIGDLFIATGTEEDGIITSGLVWEYIPSGNEENVVYTFTPQAHGFTVREGTQVDLDFKLTAGTAIGLEDTNTTDGKGKTITIKHSDVTRNSDGTVAAITQTAADLTDYVSTNNITYIKQVNTNDQGHVTKVNTQTVTLTDTNASIKEVDLSVKNTANATNSVDLTSKVVLQHPSDSNNANDFDYDSITVKSLSNNLAVSAGTAGIEFKLVWGTF